MWPPPRTYADCRLTGLKELPGARFRRRLFFRYTLVWTKPYCECELCRLEDAQLALGISRRRVQELARSGRITGRRVGRRWYLDPYSVTAYHRRERN